MQIRPATLADLGALGAFDELADASAKNIAAREIFVAADASDILAYARFNYSFFDHGWISSLVTHPAHRRRGLASALLLHLESHCAAPSKKLFISTNTQNLPMHALLARHGYTLTGQIQNLAPLPELIYFKQLPANPRL